MTRPHIFIETPRMIIRELEPEDAHGMYVMDADPQVHRYLGNKPVGNIEESRAVIEAVRQQYADNGIGRWAMLLKDTGDFVGWTGFKRMREHVNGHINHYDFGYRLGRRHWGKGLATEAARAALNYGIDTLHIMDIYAMTDIHNGASRHILEGLGFQLVEIFAYDAAPVWRHGEPITWYKLVDPRIA